MPAMDLTRITNSSNPDSEPSAAPDAEETTNPASDSQQNPASDAADPSELRARPAVLPPGSGKNYRKIYDKLLQRFEAKLAQSQSLFLQEQSERAAIETLNKDISHVLDLLCLVKESDLPSPEEITALTCPSREAEAERLRNLPDRFEDSTEYKPVEIVAQLPEVRNGNPETRHLLQHFDLYVESCDLFSGMPSVTPQVNPLATAPWLRRHQRLGVSEEDGKLRATDKNPVPLLLSWKTNKTPAAEAYPALKAAGQAELLLESREAARKARKEQLEAEKEPEGTKPKRKRAAVTPAKPKSRQTTRKRKAATLGTPATPVVPEMPGGSSAAADGAETPSVPAKKLKKAAV